MQTSVGVLLWLVERKRNSDQFGGSVAEGIGSGFWWSAVTMTTVGYGDKAPVTLIGRFMATIWMFASVITISGFTAAISGQTGAMLQDEPLLRYLLKDDRSGPEILPQVVDPQYDAIGLQRGFAHREDLNRALQDQIGADGWQQILNRYLGAR